MSAQVLLLARGPRSKTGGLAPFDSASPLLPVKDIGRHSLLLSSHSSGMLRLFGGYALLGASSNLQQLEFSAPPATAIFLFVLFSYIGVCSRKLVSLKLPLWCLSEHQHFWFALSYSWKFTRPWAIRKTNDNFSLSHVGHGSLRMAFYPDLKSFLSASPVPIPQPWWYCLNRSSVVQGGQ